MKNDELIRHWESYQQDLQSISEPLQQAFGINYFGHAIVTPDQRYFIISTDERPLDFTHQNFSVPVSGLVNYSDLKDGFLFPTYTDDKTLGWADGMCGTLIERFNMINPMMIVKKTNAFSELFYFTCPQEKAYQQYCNERDKFQNFIYYYKEKARTIIDYCKANMNKFTSEVSSQSEINHTEENLPQTRKFWLHFRNREICLTKTEYRVLMNIAHGKTAKECGKELGRPDTTINKHVENMKIKNAIYSTSDLVQMYWENHL